MYVCVEMYVCPACQGHGTYISTYRFSKASSLVILSGKRYEGPRMTLENLMLPITPVFHTLYFIVCTFDIVNTHCMYIPYYVVPVHVIFRTMLRVMLYANHPANC